MPRMNHERVRINITLAPSSLAWLERTGLSSGTSMSRIIDVLIAQQERVETPFANVRALQDIIEIVKQLGEDRKDGEGT